MDGWLHPEKLTVIVSPARELQGKRGPGNLTHITWVCSSVPRVRGICTLSPINDRERLILSQLRLCFQRTDQCHCVSCRFSCIYEFTFTPVLKNIYSSFIKNNQRPPVIVLAQQTRLKNSEKKECKMPSREESDKLNEGTFLGLNVKRNTVMQYPLHYLYYIKFSLFYLAVYHQCFAVLLRKCRTMCSKLKVKWRKQSF